MRAAIEQWVQWGTLIAVLGLPGFGMAQNSVIAGSAFNGGFAVATAAGTMAPSAVGQAFVGSAGVGATRIESGQVTLILLLRNTVGLDDPIALPAEYSLNQNYPNPFNPQTTVIFGLPAATEVHLVVYDLLGREVTRLSRGRLEAGYYQVVWNARDSLGRPVPSGVYIARMTTPQFYKSIKMILLK